MSKYQLQQVGGKLEQHDWLLNVLVLVLFVGFAGVFIAATAMLIDAFRGKQATYQSLIDKVNEQEISNVLILEELKKLNNRSGSLSCVYERGGITCNPKGE